MHAIRPIALMTLLCLTLGCGGSGGSNDEEDDPNTVQINRIAGQDGDVKAANTVDDTGTEMNTTSAPRQPSDRAITTVTEMIAAIRWVSSSSAFSLAVSP